MTNKENETTVHIVEMTTPPPHEPFIPVNEPQKPAVFAIRPTSEGATLVVTPAGFLVHDTSEMMESFALAQPHPTRRRGIYTAASIDSLLLWMDDHCTKQAPIFAVGAQNIATQWRAPDLSLVGIANYSNRESAQWHDHRVEYNFPITMAWSEWCKSHGIWMSHAQFGEFIERHLYEFSEPVTGEVLSKAVNRVIEAYGGMRQVGTPSRMYELSNGVKITVNEQIEVAVDRQSGEQSLKFTEEHKGKGGRPVAIPKFFFIRVPVFFGENPSLVGVNLRYRSVGGGAVTWCYELFAPDLVVLAAFQFACDIARNCERKVYLGSPELPGGTDLS